MQEAKRIALEGLKVLGCVMGILFSFGIIILLMILFE
jgi:hypothetical protein